MTSMTELVVELRLWMEGKSVAGQPQMPARRTCPALTYSCPASLTDRNYGMLSATTQANDRTRLAELEQIVECASQPTLCVDLPDVSPNISGVVAVVRGAGRVAGPRNRMSARL